jgi:hypothetical protein
VTISPCFLPPPSPLRPGMVRIDSRAHLIVLYYDLADSHYILDGPFSKSLPPHLPAFWAAPECPTEQVSLWGAHCSAFRQAFELRPTRTHDISSFDFVPPLNELVTAHRAMPFDAEINSLVGVNLVSTPLNSCSAAQRACRHKYDSARAFSAPRWAFPDF